MNDRVWAVLVCVLAVILSAFALIRGGPEGSQGIQGVQGIQGQAGVGLQGISGRDGKDGINGTNGKEGTSVVKTVIDATGHLIVTMSNGVVYDAGMAVGPQGPKGDPGQNTTTTTTTTTPYGTRLVGQEGGSIDHSETGGYFFLCQYQCVTSGALAFIKVNCTTVANVKVAIYADNGVLLAYNNEDNEVASGITAIPVTSVTLTAGTIYWLAFNSNVNTVGAGSMTGGSTMYKPAPYPGFTFPLQWGSGFISQPLRMLISGYY